MRSTYISILILVILALFSWGSTNLMAAEEETTEPAFSFQDSLDSLDFKFLEEYKNNLDSELESYLGTGSVKDWIVSFVSGNWDFNIKDIVQAMVSFIFKEVVANSNLLGKLIILAVISALLINLQTAFSSDVARISYLACFLALSAIAVSSFKIVLEIGNSTIENMVNFMMGMLPQMLVLTAGLGNVNASVMLFPLLMTTATAFANAIKIVVFPLIIMSAVLSIVNHISETYKLQSMAKFFTDMAKISLGFFLTFYIGVMTLRSLYSSVLDKIALRTTKYFSDNAIPVIGKMFSDTIEVAAGYVVLLKQALGMFGVIVILGIILTPVIKIAVIALIYRFAAAVVEPMGDSKTASVLEIMSAHLFLMMGAVIAVALMFFIMIAIVASMYNGWAMLR